jgi:hypothetical protein
MDNNRTCEAWASSFIERNAFDSENMIPLSMMSGVRGVGDGVGGVEVAGEFVFDCDLKENFGFCDNFFCSAATECCNCFNCCC